MDDESKEIGTVGIDKNGFPTLREPIKIRLSSFKNSKFLDIRKFYEKDGAFNPTQKGISISSEETFIKLLEILENNKEEIKNWIKAGKE